MELESPKLWKDREKIYGVSQNYLDDTGPSVVSIDGVVASLAVTEFFVMITGLREPYRLIRYRADLGRVTISEDEPSSNCYYCKSIRGMISDNYFSGSYCLMIESYPTLLVASIEILLSDFLILAQKTT